MEMHGWTPLCESWWDLWAASYDAPQWDAKEKKPARFLCARNLLQALRGLRRDIPPRSPIQNIIGSDVHHHKLAASQEPEPVSAGLQGLSADLQSHFVEKIGLILLANAGRVTGIVHHARKNVKIVGKSHATGVAELHRRALAAEENSFRKKFRGDVRGLEGCFLAFRGSIAGLRCLKVTQSEGQEQDGRENQQLYESRHGCSFQDACILQHF